MTDPEYTSATTKVADMIATGKIPARPGGVISIQPFGPDTHTVAFTVTTDGTALVAPDGKEFDNFFDAGEYAAEVAADHMWVRESDGKSLADIKLEHRLDTEGLRPPE